MKKIILLFVMMFAVSMANAAEKLYATFGSLPGGANATLNKYTWSATNNNLMPVFEFSNGELANYTTLKFTISNLTGGMVRMGYYVGGSFTEFGSGFGSSGDKTVDLTSLGIDLSTVTSIAFGGRTLNDNSTPGSVNISNVYLVPSSGENLYATFGSLPGGANATFYDYAWTNTSNNLLPIFEFSNGELANYQTLSLDITLASGSGMIRIGYYLSDAPSAFVEIGSGYGSTGTKTIDLATLNIDLSKVTKISIGGRSYNSGSTNAANFRNVYVGVSDKYKNNVFNRSFTDSQKSTVCLPIDLTESEATSAGTFYTLNSVSDGTLRFTEVSDPAAYTPYVFVPSSSTPFASLIGEKAIITVPATYATTVDGYTFQGTVESGNVPNGAYGWNSTNGVFSKAISDNVTIGAFRAYIIAPNQANARGFLGVYFGDGTTGIQEINTQNVDDDTPTYNLAGQRVNANHKGLIIKDGKKYFVK